VPPLLTLRTPDGRTAFQLVSDDLHALGFGVAAGLFTAAEVGAPHKRQRLFILAHRAGGGGQNGPAERSGARRHPSTGDTVLNARHDQSDERESEVPSPDSRTIARRITLRTGRSGDDDNMENATSQRLEGRRHAGAGLDSPADGFLSAGSGPPLWPPGPAERDRWAAVLARWPELAPAVEHAADGRLESGTTTEQQGQAAAGVEHRADGQEATERPIRMLADGLPALSHLHMPLDGKDEHEQVDCAKTSAACYFCGRVLSLRHKSATSATPRRPEQTARSHRPVPEVSCPCSHEDRDVGRENTITEAMPCLPHVVPPNTQHEQNLRIGFVPTGTGPDGGDEVVGGAHKTTTMPCVPSSVYLQKAQRDDVQSSMRGQTRVACSCSRVMQLRALGNAVVPQVAALAWMTLTAQLSPERERHD